ncbi:hypothetical protein [Cognatilysobacter bugurensis]|nr:hypothetical protein [Lysobacter bugurensis]
MDRLADTRFIPVSPAPARASAYGWLRDAVRLWRAHPFGVTGVAVVPIVFELLFQLVPGVGIVASKLLTPLATAWSFAALDARVRRGAYAPGASAGLVLSRWKPLLGLIALSFGLFCVQCAVAAWLGGPAQAVALVTGDLAAFTLGRAEIAVVFASGALLGTPLMFALPRVLLDGLGLRAALLDNLRLVRRHVHAVIAIGLVTAGAVASVVYAPWVMLIILPLGLCTGYAAYRDVDRRDAR